MNLTHIPDEHPHGQRREGAAENPARADGVAFPPAAREVAAFHARGFLHVRGLFTPPEIAALRQDILRLQDAGLLIDLLKDADPDAGAARPANLQLCPLSPHSALVAALRWHPRVLAVVRALLGEPLMFLLDQVFIKPSGRGAGTDWHQDHAYFGGGDPLLGVGMWVPLQDATHVNGTMKVVPGSHRQPVEHHRDPRSELLIRATVDPARAQVIEMQAGDALFFGFNVLHATQDNRSSEPRTAIALHFCHQHYAPPAQWTLVGPLSGTAAVAGTAAWPRALEAASP